MKGVLKTFPEPSFKALQEWVETGKIGVHLFINACRVRVGCVYVGYRSAGCIVLEPDFMCLYLTMFGAVAIPGSRLTVICSSTHVCEHMVYDSELKRMVINHFSFNAGTM